MTDDYRLLQLGEQLFELGKNIRKLEKQLVKFEKHDALSCEQALTVYRSLEQKRIQWKSLEQEYLTLKEHLQPSTFLKLSSTAKDNKFLK